MAPTLNWATTSSSSWRCGQRLRDGIYVLRIDDAVVVQRLALNPMGCCATVQS